MYQNECTVCETLRERYEAAKQRYSEAQARFEIESQTGLPDRINSARESLQASEQERIETRRDIRTHERSAHASHGAGG